MSHPSSSPPAQGPRFVRADVHPLGDERSLVVTPRGETFSVQAPAEVVDRVLEAFDGSRPIAETLARAGAPAGFAEVVRTLLADGCLREGEPGRHEADWARFESADGSMLANTRLLVVGDAHLAGRLVSLLDGRCETTLMTAEAAPAAADVAAAAATAGNAVVVALRDRFDGPWLTALDAALDAARVRWTQFHVDAGRGFFGPAVVPRRTAGYRDLLARRRCAVDEPEIFDALTAPPVGARYEPPLAELSWMLAAFAADVERWVAGVDCLSLSTEVELDPVGMLIDQHWVLPLPSSPLEGELRTSGPRDTRLLLGERTGIIQRARVIAHHESVPRSLGTVQTHNANMGRIDPEWANDVICGGSAFGDPQAARASAIGESVERYCGNHMGQSELRWASYDELIRAGEEAVDPDGLVLYSDRLYDAPGCPFTRFTRDLQVRWVKGSCVSHDRPVWLPVTLVFVNWLAAELEHRHPLTNYMNFSGIAAGRTLEHALVSGIEELVERDATMVWWMNAEPLPAVRPTAELAALWDARSLEHGQRPSLIALDNEFQIPVVAGVLHNDRDGWLNIGFAARPDPVEAAAKAWTEALTLQEGSRDLAIEDSLIRQAVDWGFASYAGLKEWRADRRYLDDYRGDFRDVTDLMCQQQVFLDRRAVDAVAAWTDVPAQRTFDELPRLPDRSLATYRSRIESRGLEIYYVDLTTPDVAAAGMCAARVVIPGLVANFPAAFPMLGRGRVQQAAVGLGWRSRPLAEDELNYWPIPHA
ncbi:MAG: YcaO-like family protein [Solirubrobacteraceae bacterium]|nr:YcaO-like family protein [Solirubrobacteraceae bacterium]